MIKETITGNIKIPNKSLEILKKNFPNCFDKNGNFYFEKFKQELSKDKDIDFSNESYGMDWLGKSYARLLATDEATTFLNEDEKWNNKEENKNSENLLIKGDNLEVLKHLSNAYHEQVKMIYIDPPYNTGSDGFVYQDDRKFTVEELSELAGIDGEKAKRILEFTQSKSNSHSAWLTFMYPRLYIAKQLLKDEGVIFVSVDDNEVAQLRLLMNEVFGEENFVAEVIWERAFAPVNLKKYFSESHDYILIFAKNLPQIDQLILTRSSEANKRYKNPDNDPRGAWQSGDFSVGPAVQDNIYEITTPSGMKVLPPNGSSWRVSKEKFEEMLANNEVWFGNDGNGVPRQKRFLSNVKQGVVPMTLWKYSEVDHSQEATKQLKEMFGNKHIFDYPKPTKLIKRCLDLVTDKNDLILDFFAGSGTTGDAVMQINTEDGGNRKYILVQLPEPIDPNKDKVAYDFVKDELGTENPTIFEICKERLIRAARKIQEDNKDKDLSNIDFGFKIFETVPNDEGNWKDYILKAESFDLRQELFNESKLNEKDLKMLLTTWKTYDGFSLTQNLIEIDLDGYKGHYLDNKLYLVDKDFETKNLIRLLEEIDSKEYFSPATIIAFGYNFESTTLREIADNVKNYANKKQIDIDFIARY